MTSQQTTIVIIEDDPRICLFLRTSLRLRGFAVIETHSGEKGLQAVCQPSSRTGNFRLRAAANGRYCSADYCIIGSQLGT
jgi:ActR/RegA family two-component response regulator